MNIPTVILLGILIKQFQNMTDSFQAFTTSYLYDFAKDYGPLQGQTLF